MSCVKKYLTFICIICLLFTMMPAGITTSADSNDDIIEFMTKRDKDPAYLSAMASSLVTVDSLLEGENYVLRDMADMDMTVIEISVLYNIPEEEEEMLRACLEELFVFFADKPAEFDAFIHYLMNTENYILPVGDQAAFETLFPWLSAEIETYMYSFTYFMNLLYDFNNAYMAQNGETLLYYSDERIHIRGNVADLFSSPEVLGEGKEELTEAVYNSMTSAMNSAMNNADENERGQFINYLIVNGIVGDEIPASSFEIDEMTETLYSELSPVYSEKNGIVKAFELAEDICNEYLPRIQNTDATGAGTDLIREAMSRAAIINIDIDDIVRSGAVTATFGNDEVFNFAYVNAQKVRNLFIEKGIPVVKTMTFSMNIVADGTADYTKATISFPESVLSVSANNTVSDVNVAFAQATVSVKTSGMLSSGILSGGNIKISVSSEPAESKLPGYAQLLKNADILSVDIYSGGAMIYDEIPAYAVSLYVAPESGQDFSENSFYWVTEAGEYTKVSSYVYDGSAASFALGEGRMFAYVPEFGDTSVDDTNGETQTPKPSSKPISGNTGNDEDDESEQTQQPEETPQIPETVKPTPDVPEIEVNFSDVSENHWARKYIYGLAKRGILSGVGDGLFAPEANITREQFAKIIVEAFGLRDDSATCDFSDVVKGSWYEIYVASAQKHGIINGIGDGLFGVSRNITRQDMAVMIARAAEAAGVSIPAKKGMPSFEDYVEVSSYAILPVRILTSGAIINGYEDNTFRPFANATRAQAAKMIYMLILE